MDGGYFAIRGLLAKSVSEAVAYVAQKGVVDEAAPCWCASWARSQAGSASWCRKAGRAGGADHRRGRRAAVNVAFTEHFQSLAKGHFTVRRLERLYSPEMVKREYQRIAAAQGYATTKGAA